MSETAVFARPIESREEKTTIAKIDRFLTIRKLLIQER
jgi:3,4-dihydroxy-2-butanone 4-phosphate synthase